MKLNLKLLSILLVVGGATACSPISGQQFNEASPFLQNKYCKTQQARFQAFGQYVDPRCAYLFAEQSHDEPVNRIIFNDMTNRG